MKVRVNLFETVYSYHQHLAKIESFLKKKYKRGM